MHKRFFQHYKGGVYVLIAEARHSEDHECELIVYANCEDRSKVWVRPKKMFFEDVAVRAHDGSQTRVPRFKEISLAEKNRLIRWRENSCEGSGQPVQREIFGFDRNRTSCHECDHPNIGVKNGLLNAHVRKSPKPEKSEEND